jgi:hypothetical protein
MRRAVAAARPIRRSRISCNCWTARSSFKHHRRTFFPAGRAERRPR